MKVKELIVLLQTQDPEAKVLKEVYGGMEDVYGVRYEEDISGVRSVVFNAVVIE